MRIWSLHPKYLDTKGLVALWREALLAKNVLEGNTNGYKNHPQLTRFKNSGNSVDCINQYLQVVYEESLKRGYCFNRNKFIIPTEPTTLTVTSGQIEYEKDRLIEKLKTRDPERPSMLLKETKIDAHPLFRIIDGDIEEWEKNIKITL
jgi:hypothetical protein